MLKKQKFNDSVVINFGFLGGMAEAIYCFAFAFTVTIVGRMNLPPPPEIAAALLFLIVFVFSVAVSGIFVFGYPAYLAVQNRFAEAIMTLATTLVTLAIIGILVFLLITII
ncbi:MAG: hypothetical protein A2729_03920 [Candidatus Buchananbacteria bacterium RIFCSPHIGHO2_01_FULL_39_14]|uniref:Uncharacterized protein n=2 Tax=Candidatus Buchananiibacteriota TaxID=1817903 RepID=A0A1G1YWS2_9BACT|nr:MAG: hypothetical protein A2729_03920 [Candidatus Buchananbacteria bacterium RIFCSPHIGHO2_01_FULL_39_14]OGY48615.1 MAG: hypothetical protein A3D39_05115 [Candidatus Buchananbacteria bacterium RIFCSPHIGHO2_02_FULL_39_17]OGY56040.1 MAG: hypothetical protein A2912_03495 [Candidatus Buchananbacteria bacterium RIFCSPLOWO2_01_FULL_40_23b]